MVRLESGDQGSFETQLNKFETSKSCCCSEQVFLEPDVRKVGDFLLVEIDRGHLKPADSEDIEISLLSLELESTIKLFKQSYQVAATVHLKLGKNLIGQTVQDF